MSKYSSVFDIVGPSMIGPSSSHTAGAAKIGLMARNIFNAQPQNVQIILYGSFAKTYKGHGTDLALIGGLLGYSADDRRIVNSAQDALRLGININLTTSDEETDHPNTAKIIMNRDNRTFEIVGISPGGGRAEIVEINGFKVKAAADNNFLLVFHHDRYGVIAAVANLLASHGINIGHMEVARKSKGAEALMVIQTDQQVPDDITIELKELAHVTGIVAFNKNSGR
ncbi:L-serine dehydratase [Desulfohalotomaculum tongense]|uniref:L-serine ammonia-lyase, iron-sulfur-dependent subunit beta n=1 Tax=Desulforadius tongensis TaxID=1216062 RepID=UPI0019575472|nr:L-serine ammonia-lyase, iron-sulfur-dependent subunit beta [Desulforadius tongensis]MBM7855389.1 L-serine dehydratase [Desulforadius tongensis]